MASAKLRGEFELERTAHQLMEIAAKRPGELTSFATSLRESTLFGTLLRLNEDERERVVKALLPQLGREHTPTVNLINRTLETSGSPFALSNLVAAVGVENFEASQGFRHVEELVRLGQGWSKLTDGKQLAATFRGSPADCLDQLHRALKGNQSTADEVGMPVIWAASAMKLERCFVAELHDGSNHPNHAAQLIEKYSALLDLYKRTGVGIVDFPQSRFTADEAQRISRLAQTIPAWGYLASSPLIDIERRPLSGDDKQLVGEYQLGRIRLFASPAAAGEEMWSSCVVNLLCRPYHTICFQEFRALSGWEIVPAAGEKTTADGARMIKVLEDDGDRAGSMSAVSSKSNNVWAFREGSEFVSESARNGPFRDYLETMNLFLTSPGSLQALAPSKYELMNFLYGTRG